jgi:hypothetical protein
MVLTGGPEKFGGSSSDSTEVGEMISDGTSLFLFFNGQIFKVSTAGVVSPALAGVYMQGLDFDATYDPHMSHPVASVEFPASPGGSATAGISYFMAMDQTKNIYVSSTNSNSYVEKINCP